MYSVSKILLIRREGMPITGYNRTMCNVIKIKCSKLYAQLPFFLLKVCTRLHRVNVLHIFLCPT